MALINQILSALSAKSASPNFQADNSVTVSQDDMRPEYDFSGGVRGKHHQAYRKGHTVKIHQSDGNVVVQHFSLEDGAVFLEPDVREYFPEPRQ